VTRAIVSFRRRLRSVVRGARRRLPVTVQAGYGAGLRLDLRQASADYRAGTNELPVQEAIARHLRPGDVLYDVGSNIGFFALIGARSVGPNGSVHAFEPVLECARAIEENAARNHFHNVRVHRVAVGDREDVVELRRTTHPGGATISPKEHPPDTVSSVQVPCVALDAYRQQAGLPEPALVKIDVEGVEEEVLRGMERILERDRPILVYEVDAPDDARLRMKTDAVDALLERAGYTVTRLPLSYPNVGWTVVHFLAEPRADVRPQARD
jgi:FkbM family methyltransferase